MRPLHELAHELDLRPQDLVAYGAQQAKIALPAVHRPGRQGRLILISAMSPAPAGEGKTTVAIGLVDALRLLGASAAVAIRQPSMGPVFGRKGGGSGGGLAQLVPGESINLHFTGDLHAITQAHNLLASAVDNALHFGSHLAIEPRSVTWPRVLDVNERALRHVVVGLGGSVPRESQFAITAASEIMAVLALSRSWAELRQRLGSVVIGLSRDGNPVTAEDLRVAGAMAALLRDALQPNLVQTMGGSPALVHCGPFANIAHGTSSLVGTLAGLRGADLVLQEAGFGADLGGEKFLDLFCPQLGQFPSLGVVVFTLQGLRFHGGGNVDAGMPNLLGQLQRLQRFGLPVVACLNGHGDDDAAVSRGVIGLIRQSGYDAFAVDVFGRGGAGALQLAEYVRAAGPPAPCQTAYHREHTLREKIERIACGVYGASGVDYSVRAQRELAQWESLGFGSAFCCMAKTQYSLSGDLALVGVPRDFRIVIDEVQLRAAAGFIVPIAGSISTMPALPSRPNFEDIDLNADGTIVGL